MSLAVTSIIGAAVGVGSLAYTISSSQQQARLASQAKDAAQLDATSAQNTALKQKADQSEIEQRNLSLASERRRSTPVGGAVTGIPPAAWSSTTPAPTPSPATVNRGQGTLVGS